MKVQYVSIVTVDAFMNKKSLPLKLCSCFPLTVISLCCVLVQGGKEYNLRAHFGLPSVTSGELLSWQLAWQPILYQPLEWTYNCNFSFRGE